MIVTQVLTMCVVCWLVVNDLSVDASQSVIYSREDFEVPCEVVFDYSFPTSSRIGCAAACQPGGCGFFQYENGLCSRGEVGEIPIGILDARYVKTLVPASLNKQYLSVIGKPAHSDTPWNAPVNQHAGLAVDGNLASPSYFHSYPSHTNAWWVLDLENEYVISDVEVQSSSGHLNYFRTMEVRVGKTFTLSQYIASRDFSSWHLVGSYVGPAPNQNPISFSCGPGAVGRYISVQRMHTGSGPYFAISEVNVKIFVMP